MYGTYIVVIESGVNGQSALAEKAAYQDFLKEYKATAGLSAVFTGSRISDGLTDRRKMLSGERHLGWCRGGTVHTMQRTGLPVWTYASLSAGPQRISGNKILSCYTYEFTKTDLAG